LNSTKKIFCFMSVCLIKNQKTKTRFMPCTNRRSITSPKAKITNNTSTAIKHRKRQCNCCVVSHEKTPHDSHTLPEILNHIEQSRAAVKQAVVDRGYRGKKEVNGTEIILPKKALKRDNRYQRDKKRKQCRRRAAIEPIIGHLKSDYRLSRNFLKGIAGDEINRLLAATAWNLKQWLIAFLALFFPWVLTSISLR